MKSFAERNSLVIGAVGCAVIAGLVLAATQYDKLPFLSAGNGYSAYLAEAGGLRAGAAVQVFGYRVGQVSAIELDGPRVLVKFTVAKEIRLGDRTEAAVKTKSVLGTKVFEVTPRGDGLLPGTIPLARTTPAYQLPDALGDLATTISGLNTNQLSDSLATLAQTFQDTPPELKTAVQGVARLSQTIGRRDTQLRNLLSNASKVTAVIAERAGQIASLIERTNAFMVELQTQSNALNSIAYHVSALAKQLSGFVADNRAQLRPALDKLNGVLTIVDNRKERVQKSIQLLNAYVMSLGEAVSGAPFFKAYVANLLPGQFVQPFVDAAFSDLGLDPSVLLPSQRADPPVGQPGTPALPVPYPRTGQGGEPNLRLPDAITGKPGDPRYPYRPPLPQPPPGGPPPGPPARYQPRRAPGGRRRLVAAATPRRARRSTDAGPGWGTRWGRTMSALRNSKRGLATVLVALLIAGLVTVVRQSGQIDRATVVAYFENSNGIFVGDEVRILGVPVGKIDKIEPQPHHVKITFWYDRNYHVPVDARAVILSPSLVTSRAIQLTPAYTGGATVQNDAVIPQDRTAVPVEWDDVRAQLEKLVQMLRPTEPGGVAPLGSFINTAADNLRGEGANIRDTVIKLSQALSVLGDHSSDIFSTVKNLATVVAALQDSTGLMRQLNRNLAYVTGLLANDPNKVGAAVQDLNTAVSDVQGFVAENRESLGVTSDKLASLSKAVTDSLDDIKQTLHIAPNALQNYTNIWRPTQGALSGALMINNFASTVSFLCGAVQAASRLNAEQSAKLCVQYLAPIIKNRQYNFPPLGENLFVGTRARPNEVTYSEDWMRPDFVPPAPNASPAEPAPAAPQDQPPAANPAPPRSAATDPSAGLPGMMVPPGGR